jgi:hypothetical protein
MQDAKNGGHWKEGKIVGICEWEEATWKNYM